MLREIDARPRIHFSENKEKQKSTETGLRSPRNMKSTPPPPVAIFSSPILNGP